MEPFEFGSNSNEDGLDRTWSNNTSASSTLLPEKSYRLYEKQYKLFILWNKDKYENIYTENVFLTYFTEKAKVVKSSTLWSTYSMLKATFMIKHNIDMSKFSNLLMFLKQKNVGYKPKITSIFTSDHLIKFLIEAPDSNYLMLKVCFMFGVVGACSNDELKKITINDVDDKDTVLIIKIFDSITGKKRRFTITNDMAENLEPIQIYRKYRSLRPSHTNHKSLFIFYRSGKCSTQPIGINTFGKIPRLIATYLKLPNANSFTGHAFRRTSASVFADSGYSSCALMRRKRPRRNFATVAAEDYVESSNIEINERAPNLIETTPNIIETTPATTFPSYFLPLMENCRTCMGFLTTPRNLRTDNYCKLLQILQGVLGFEISGEDFNICEGCESRLKSILDFKNICLKTFEYFSRFERMKPKEEPIDTIDDSMFDFDLKKSHLKNRYLDVEIDGINSKHLENSTSIESNSTNSTKNEQTVTNLNLHQGIIESSANIKSISTKQISRLRQFPKTDVLAEIARCENMLDSGMHKNCRLCDYIGNTFADLCSHMICGHRNRSESWCCECNLLTDDLQKHKESSKCTPFFCKFCKEFYGDMKELLTHLRTHYHSIHSSDNSESEFDEELSSKLKNTLEQASTTLTDFIKVEPQYDSIEEEDLNQSESDYDISDNQIMSNQEAALDMNQDTETESSSPERLKKSHTGENKFICDQCHKSFHIKSLLEKHIRSHSDDRPFQCGSCEQSFKDKYSLSLHTRTHTGSKFYRCTFCEFRAVKASYLTRHMQQHPEDAPQTNNPHKCDLCLLSFSTNANVLAHMENEHEDAC